MAYSHTQYTVNLVDDQPAAPSLLPTSGVPGVLLSATGNRARWSVGHVPCIIRGAAIKPSVAAFSDPVHCAFEGDISAIGTATRLFKIVIPTAGLTDKAIFYKATYVITLPAGSTIDFNVTAAASGGVMGRVSLFLEPHWEHPTNVTGLLHTT